MSRLYNPRVQVKVLQPYEKIFTLEDISFSIDKDLSEEPNTAELRIYNLTESNRAFIQDAADSESPIEISLTRAGRANEDPVLAFKGEIDFCKSSLMRPGVETMIACTSQKRNHRSFFFSQNFAAGTPINEIINAFVDAIGLPAGNQYDLPTSGITLSESFSGQAYPLLQRYVFDLAMYCYILDGKLYITDAFTPPSPLVFMVDPAHMLTAPEPRVRQDRSFVSMQALVESGSRVPFPARLKNRKRKKRKIQALGKTHYVEYETTNQTIKGMEFTIFCQPHLNPDSIVSYGNTPALNFTNVNLYRVIDLSHYGDNFGGDWTTELRTDDYNDDGGDYLAGLEFVP